MKEIGKLIELFKDYVENYGNDTKDPTIDYAVIYDGQGFYVGARFYSDEKVLSKKFGFIKWLVENDKIDLYKLPIRLEEYYQSTEAVGYITDDETILLMQLAVQDEPISFLCEILK